MINYQNIADSIEYYSQLWFSRIESPWTVSEEIAAITRPPDKIPYELTHNQKVLVGSGEQSFLYLYLKGFLPKGRYQTVTPCFRDDLFDKTHTKYFIKNELIITDHVTKSHLHDLTHSAFKFFKSKLGLRECNVYVEATSEWGYDIVFKYQPRDKDVVCVELGSYGIRHCEFLSWIYGTGCAEPRLSYCQEYQSPS